MKLVNKKKYYYIIKGEYLDNNFIKKVMDKRDIWEEFNIKNPQKKNPDYIHLDGIYCNYKIYWKYITELRSQIKMIDNQYNIVNKFNIVELLKKLKNLKLNNMLLEQHKINLYQVNQNRKLFNSYQYLFKTKKVWILKFIYGKAGENIVIINSFNDFKRYLENVIKIYNEKWNKLDYNNYLNLSRWKKSYYYIDWVLQEYIINPMLYEKKKFHLRGYFVYYNNKNNTKSGYFFNNQRVYTAKLPFINKDYLNKDIHDSHGGTTKKEINFKPDITNLLTKKQVEKIENDLLFLFKNIFKITKNKCYEEDKSCYHLYGTDIMITDNYELKLIEINMSPGFKKFKKQKINYFHIIFEEIMKNIVDKQFPLLKNKKKLSKKIKIKKSSSKKNKIEQPKLIKL